MSLLAKTSSTKPCEASNIPKIVYHGTNAHFDFFDLSFKGSNTGWANTIHGFFFTENIDHAKMFGDNILTCEIEIVKPLNIVLHQIFSIESQAAVIFEALSDRVLSPKKALKRLNEDIGLGEIGDLFDTLHSEDAHRIIRKYGYDGIISHFGNDHLEYIAFDPKQIKIIR